MEKLWIALSEKLSTDATLISMTGYTTSTNTIKRSNTIDDIAFSSTVTEAVTFGQWTKIRISPATTDPLKNVTFLVVCWSKKNDLKAMQLADYLEILLDGVDLSNADIQNFYSEYDDFTSPPFYEKDENIWRVDLRFRFVVALK